MFCGNEWRQGIFGGGSFGEGVGCCGAFAGLGASAWAVAGRQARRAVEGYLGAVAVSPFTTLRGLEEPFCSVLGLAMMRGWVEWDGEGRLEDSCY